MDYEHVSGLTGGSALLKFVFYRTGKFFAKPRSWREELSPPGIGQAINPGNQRTLNWDC